MGDVRVINTRAKWNGEFVEQRVSELQAMVEAKGVSNVVIIGVTTDGDIIDSWANTNDPYALLGAMSVLMQEFREAAIEPRGGQS